MRGSSVRLVLLPPLVAALAAGCSRSKREVPAGDAPPLTVTIARATSGSSASGIEVGGLVQAQTTAMVTARILATVREVRVAPSDRVRAGDVLVVLDGRDLAAGAHSARAAAAAAAEGARAAAADVRAADAALALARATYDRVSALNAKRSATPHELDEATAALRTAEARAASAAGRSAQAESGVESARTFSTQTATLESYTRLTAPFDGVVTAKLVEAGNMASPGMPLVRVEDTRRFRLEVRVDESRATSLEVGTHVPVVVGDGAGVAPRKFEGRVEEIARAVDADARAVVVKIGLPEATDLRSGMFGRVTLPQRAGGALVIPAEALVRHGQVTSTFVVDKGVARLRLVNVRGTEVLAGLTEGEIVVVNPPPGLVDGRRVVTGGAR